MARMSLTSVIMSTLVHAHHASSTLASLCDPADGAWKLAAFVLVPSASLIQHAVECSEMFRALCGQSHGLHWSVADSLCASAQHEDAPILENQLTSRVFSEVRCSRTCRRLMPAASCSCLHEPWLSCTLQ